MSDAAVRAAEDAIAGAFTARWAAGVGSGTAETALGYSYMARLAVEAARPVIAQQIVEFLDDTEMDGPDDAADVIREQFIRPADSGVDR